MGLEIVGIVLALVALVVGVPPFTQMLFGRPKIVIGFDDFTGDDASKAFMVSARNVGIKSRLIKALGVVSGANYYYDSPIIVPLGEPKAAAVAPAKPGA